MHIGKKIVDFIKNDFSRMTPFERWRLVFLCIQIIITIGVPFIAVWLSKNWN